MHVTHTSLPRRAARRSVATETRSPRSARARAASPSALAWSVSSTHARSSGSTAAIAASWISPWTPHPTTVAARESARARCFAATAVAAPVRRAVTLAESIIARGSPVSASASTTVPRMVGRPKRRGFSGKLAFVLAAK